MGSLALSTAGSPAYRLLGILACLFAVTAITVAATHASASAAAPRLDASLTGTATGGGSWCCGSFTEFQGSGVVMGVGAVDFTGTFRAGCDNPLIFDPALCFRMLDLLLVARNGDTLAVQGDDRWLLGTAAPQVTTWSVDETSSTGRFAGFAASGTYVFAVESPGVSITLSGSRTH
jgi:hypothetical protein